MARAELRGVVLAKASSQKTSRSTTPPLERPIFASDLLGDQSRLERLVLDRASKETCLECGRVRAGYENYCKACLGRFPLVTNVESPFDAWQYFVSQNRPAYDGPAFHAMRRGIFERASQRTQWLGSADSFEHARHICLKKLRQAGAVL
jgi:hypothetical protein